MSMRFPLASWSRSALLAAFALAAAASGTPKPTVAASKKLHPKPKHRVVHDPSGVAMPVGNLRGWKQVFKDDFTGKAPDPRWQAYSGAVGGATGGWWATSHVVVGGGELVLKTYRDPAACTDPASCPLFNDEVSGGVKSKFTQTYGKFLIRVRTRPVADVSFSALLWPKSNVSPPETDFALEGGAPHLTTIGAMLKFGAPLTVVPDSVKARPAKWHTLGVVWSPGKLRYTIDGHVWATEVNANVSTVPMNIVLQSQTDCQSVTMQTCKAPWASNEPSVDIAWVVAYARRS